MPSKKSSSRSPNRQDRQRDSKRPREPECKVGEPVLAKPKKRFARALDTEGTLGVQVTTSDTITNGITATTTIHIDEKTSQESTVPVIALTAREAFEKISSAEVNDADSAEWLRKASAFEPGFMHECDHAGHSLLTAAAAAGKLKTLCVLVERGGDVRTRQPNGHDTLTTALLNRHFEVCDHLTSQMGMDLSYANGLKNLDLSKQILEFLQCAYVKLTKLFTTFLPTTGGVMTGNIDMDGTNEVTNLHALRFPYDIIIGPSASASYDYESVAIGKLATTVGGMTAISIGSQSEAVADGAVAVGGNSSAADTTAVCVGFDARSTGNNSNCFGADITNSTADSLLIRASANFRSNSTTCDMGTVANPFKTLYLNGSIAGPSNTRTADNIVSNGGTSVGGRIPTFADTTGKVVQDSGFTILNQCGYKFIMPGQNTINGVTAMTSMTAASDRTSIGDMVYPADTCVPGTVFQLVLPATLTLSTGNVTINATMNGTVICTLTLNTVVAGAIGMVEAKFMWRHSSALEVTIVAEFNGIPATYARARLVANSTISNTFDLQAQPSATSTNLATMGGYMYNGHGYVPF